MAADMYAPSSGLAWTKTVAQVQLPDGMSVEHKYPIALDRVAKSTLGQSCSMTTRGVLLCYGSTVALSISDDEITTPGARYSLSGLHMVQ